MLISLPLHKKRDKRRVAPQYVQKRPRERQNSGFVILMLARRNVIAAV